MRLAKVIASALLVLLTVVPAHAQNDNSRVMVPEAPSGAVVAGCFQSDRLLFGFNLACAFAPAAPTW